MKRIHAFPERTDEGYDKDGMTLRDWFAGQALAGMADYAIKDDDMAWSDLARNCYRVADAMLSERDK